MLVKALRLHLGRLFTKIRRYDGFLLRVMMLGIGRQSVVVHVNARKIFLKVSPMTRWRRNGTINWFTGLKLWRVPWLKVVREDLARSEVQRHADGWASDESCVRRLPTSMWL